MIPPNLEPMYFDQILVQCFMGSNNNTVFIHSNDIVYYLLS